MRRRTSGRTRWQLALMLSVLTLLSACCTTSPVVGPSLPALEWPAFPAPDGVTLADGVVSMPLDYWLGIARYAVDVERVREIIDAWRAEQ